jgi:hypothetical protein
MFRYVDDRAANQGTGVLVSRRLWKVETNRVLGICSGPSTVDRDALNNEHPDYSSSCAPRTSPRDCSPAHQLTLVAPLLLTSTGRLAAPSDVVFILPQGRTLALTRASPGPTVSRTTRTTILWFQPSSPTALVAGRYNSAFTCVITTGWRKHGEMAAMGRTRH